MKSRQIISTLLIIQLLVTMLAIPTFADEVSDSFPVNSINDTRWQDHLCVYRNLEHTGQNEWGDNVIVDSKGVVIGKIPAADLRGKELAIPQGGMVVSGTGDIGKKVYDAAAIGDKCVFDETNMTVRFVKSGAEVFSVNSINDTRWESHICVYRDLEHTGQNEWGENVIIDSNGIVIEKIPSGDLRGKNLSIPEGGMVVSGTNDIGKKMYDAAEIGNKCLFDEYSMAVCFTKVDAKMFFVDSLNGTRWDNYICVYRGIEHTGQNEWGQNLIVDSNGNVIEKIPAGDANGKNLAVPEGGFVVSGTGDIGKALYAAAEIGDKCLFDDYSMRVYFAKGAVDPFYKMDLRVTGYNSERWADTVIIYNQSGKTTGTNVHGYEVCVDVNGYVISAGGNNNVVPQGGYVISAVEAADKNILKMYFMVGAKCTLGTNSVTAEYGAEQLVKTVESELNIAKARLQIAKSHYKLVDYAKLEAKIAAVKFDEIKTVQERNAVIAQIRELDPMFVESRLVDTRSVWYNVLETSADEVKTVVAEIKAAGFNELVLSADSVNGTIVPIDTQKIPFKRNPITEEFDILQAYIDECRANGISIIILTPVMSNNYATHNSEWLDVTNTGTERDEKFISPANSEYRKAYMDFLSFIVTNYDVDGIQLDFIRYPQFYGGIDAGYDNATINLFKEKTGLGEDVVKAIGQQLTAHPKWSVWHNFKTELISSWVEDAYGLVREAAPELYVTASVAASAGVSEYCQNPNAWLTNGYIDGIYVMSYVEGINESTVTQHISHRGDKSYLVMGCGAYLSISNKSLLEQADNAAIYGADGMGYFEWGAVKSHGYTELLKSTLFKNDAVPFTADVKTVVDRLVATAKARLELYCSSADQATANEIKAILAALPNENADKDDITTAITALSDLLGDSEEKYLTADLNSAIRAINMKRTNSETTDPSEPSDPSDPSEPSDPSDPSEPFPPTDPDVPSDPSDDPSDPSDDPSDPSEPSDTVDPDPDEPKDPIEEPEIIKGDINGKDGIDSMDYVLLKRAYFGTYTLKDIKVGDINNNGIIDSMDYVYLRRAYFGTYVIK